MNLFKLAFNLMALFCAVGGVFFALFCTPEKLDTSEMAGPQYV